MNSRRIVAALVAAAAATMAPVIAHAQVTQYNSLAAYLAAVSNPGTDTYTGFNTSGITPSPINRSAGVYSYTATASGDFYGANVGGNAALSTLAATSAVIFSGFTSTVRGVGGNFFDSDIGGAFVAGDIRLDWIEVGGATGFTTLVGATTSTFFGVVSAGGGFTSFTVTSVQPAAGLNWQTIDNFVLGAAGTSAVPENVVPEPQTYALVAAGLLAVGVMARRRRA